MHEEMEAAIKSNPDAHIRQRRSEPQSTYFFH